MIGIYLCDDEEAVLHQLKTALEWKIFIENYDMEVACAASSAGELLAAARDGSRSVYFLDVDLRDGEWDGFTLGRELRRRDPHGTLVYITSYGDLAWKTRGAVYVPAGPVPHLAVQGGDALAAGVAAVGDIPGGMLPDRKSVV